MKSYVLACFLILTIEACGGGGNNSPSFGPVAMSSASPSASTLPVHTASPSPVLSPTSSPSPVASPTSTAPTTGYPVSPPPNTTTSPGPTSSPSPSPLVVIVDNTIGDTLTLLCSGMTATNSFADYRLISTAIMPFQSATLSISGSAAASSVGASDSLAIYSNYTVNGLAPTNLGDPSHPNGGDRPNWNFGPGGYPIANTYTILGAGEPSQDALYLLMQRSSGAGMPVQAAVASPSYHGGGCF